MKVIMNKHEREDFRLFCLQATDNQLVAIIKKENQYPNDLYRQVCAAIAETVATDRGLF